MALSNLGSLWIVRSGTQSDRAISSITDCDSRFLYSNSLTNKFSVAEEIAALSGSAHWPVRIIIRDKHRKRDTL